MRLQDAQVLWTVYFDSTVTRSHGRRLPLNLCVPDPSLQQVLEACNAEGIEIVEHKTAKYPRRWWKRGGYAAVRTNQKKSELLRRIAKALKRTRS